MRRNQTGDPPRAGSVPAAADRDELGQPAPPVVELSRGEHREAEQRSAVRAPVVYKAIRREGEDELRRPARALAWSGFAAGLSMGFSLVAALNHAQVVAGSTSAAGAQSEQ
ncbi:MAG TPA: hypothetical protein VKV26_18035 [Dehalococcoidia bacterium]|nr:hypothetical protein [Dehalococcoidia bacterium]